MTILLAPMEGLLDCTLRDALTQVGGVQRCVSEFIRVTDQLLPLRSFTRVAPELLNGGFTPAGVPLRPHAPPDRPDYRPLGRHVHHQGLQCLSDAGRRHIDEIAGSR